MEIKIGQIHLQVAASGGDKLAMQPFALKVCKVI